MATYIILEIDTKPECQGEMKAMLTSNLPQALAFDGCLSVELVENVEKPGNLVFFERWKSKEHYEKYYAWRESTGVLAAFSAMLSAPPSFRYFVAFVT
jgi:quinol monooxygenase YgiN